MVSNATFNNISVISWWSVLLVKEIDNWYFQKILYQLFRNIQRNKCPW